jgi:hypothetical protein
MQIRSFFLIFTERNMWATGNDARCIFARTEFRCHHGAVGFGNHPHQKRRNEFRPKPDYQFSRINYLFSREIKITLRQFRGNGQALPDLHASGFSVFIFLHRTIDDVLYAGTNVPGKQFGVQSRGMYPVAQEDVYQFVFGVYPETGAGVSRVAVDAGRREISAGSCFGRVCFRFVEAQSAS